MMLSLLGAEMKSWNSEEVLRVVERASCFLRDIFLSLFGYFFLVDSNE